MFADGSVAPATEEEAARSRQPRPDPAEAAAADPDDARGRAAGAPAFLPYRQTSFLPLRLTALAILLAATTVLGSLAVLVLPVGLGRSQLSQLGFQGDSSAPPPQHDALHLMLGASALIGTAEEVVW